ncbi:unnamed protein product [Ixodes hexagonus]
MLKALCYVLLVTVPAVLLWILNRRRQHSLFRKHGIPGPEPELIWGNFKQLKKNRLQVLDEWIKQYGKVFGFYMAEKPYMVVTDLDLIRQSFVKESRTFQDRPRYFVELEPFVSTLLFLKGKWLRNIRIRSYGSKGAKLSRSSCSSRSSRSCARKSFVLLQNCCATTNIFVLYRATQIVCMLALVASASLAREVNCQQDSDDPLLKAARALILDADTNLVETAIAMPGMRTLLGLFYPFTSYCRMLGRLLENINDTVRLRRKEGGTQHKDMLQMMLDAQAGKEDAAHDVRKKGPLIEDRHVIANSLLLLMAGYETTGAALAFTLYLLAVHPEEQEKVHSELAEQLEQNSELAFDDVHRLKRLDLVIREAVRLYPSVPILVARTCLPDTTVNGQFIPAGTTLLAPAWSIHRNPEYWPEPTKFIPDRFAEDHPERHPMAYFPFGLGPRLCLGWRLALLEMKMAVCGILRDYKLAPCKETQNPTPVGVPGMTLRPEGGIKVKLEARSRQL